MKTEKPGKAFVIIAGAVAILFLLSFVPWEGISGNRLKSFGLFSDLFPSEVKVTANEAIDPELTAALAELDETVTDASTETIDEHDTPSDVLSPANTTVVAHDDDIDNVSPDGSIVIEDYTAGGSGLSRLRDALADSHNRMVRIAVIGDSYIEGDILTMNLREMLQDRFGGRGVGYVPASTEIAGFRTSVREDPHGWTRHELRTDAPADMKIIQGEYFTATDNAHTTYKGVARLHNVDRWDNTSVMVVAPAGGNVTITTDAGDNTYELEDDADVQWISLRENTSKAAVSVSAGVNVLGVFLDGDAGVAVDNMSLRGNSGQTHRKLSVERAAQMRPYADYDLIIMEYGINALSSQQSDYSGYATIMTQTIERLKECYPGADILVLGIGDRGQKLGSEVKSIPTAGNMVSAQRKAARKAGVMFWDTRKAMGGDDAVVEWRRKGYINPDYIHLNAKGGKALADLLFNAIMYSLEN